MDKIIKCEFYISTKYIGSEVKEIVEITIPKGTSLEEEEDIIREQFEEWVWETTNNSFTILNK